MLRAPKRQRCQWSWRSARRSQPRRSSSFRARMTSARLTPKTRETQLAEHEPPETTTNWPPTRLYQRQRSRWAKTVATSMRWPETARRRSIRRGTGTRDAGARRNDARSSLDAAIRGKVGRSGNPMRRLARSSSVRARRRRSRLGLPTSAASSSSVNVRRALPCRRCTISRAAHHVRRASRDTSPVRYALQSASNSSTRTSSKPPATRSLLSSRPAHFASTTAASADDGETQGARHTSPVPISNGH